MTDPHHFAPPMLLAGAYTSSLAGTDENVRAHAEALALLGRKVDVALRFVDWYAEKGDSYEYNAASLERHMNALAVGNRPRAAQSVMSVSGAPLSVPPVAVQQQLQAHTAPSASSGGRGALAGSSGNASAPVLHVPWDASAATRAAYEPLAVTGGKSGPAGERHHGAQEGGARALPLTGSAGVRIGGVTFVEQEES
jgi:hypothetical protein